MRKGIILENTPLGVLSFIEEDDQLVELNFGPLSTDVLKEETPVLLKAKEEIQEYFQKNRSTFTVPYKLKGTDFQIKVWNALCTIPYGETASYKEIAVKIGNPKACRAIGMANHRNPLPIIVPCHRVINADGSLGGYGGGIDRKITLLETEKQHL